VRLLGDKHVLLGEPAIVRSDSTRAGIVKDAAVRQAGPRARRPNLRVVRPEWVS
jgi:hypothetical protein